LVSLQAVLLVRFTHARGTPTTGNKSADSELADMRDITAVRVDSVPRQGSSDVPTLIGALPPSGDTTVIVAQPVEPDTRSEVRVLLVGNSYTMHHSLHTLLQRLAAGVEGGPHVIVEAVAHGGYSLRNHLRTGTALQRIRAGRYTHVVLQGHSLSALDHPSELAADAERFKQAIDAAASRTVFYATWARSPEVSLYRTHRTVHSFADMSARVSSAYFEIASHLGAALAPVGSAFERSLVEHPKLTLWGADGSHPSLAGSYMAACVLYGAITGVDPSESRYVPPGMQERDAVVIRAVAAESLAATKSSASAQSLGTTTATSVQLRSPL
jgi:hypothetical protein